jgi:predicted DNA-binding transcriptional regulator AlpA
LETTMNTPTVRKILTLREIEAMTGAHRKTIMSWVERGTFPQPLAIGGRKLWWNAEAVERILTGRQEAGGGKMKR